VSRGWAVTVTIFAALVVLYVGGRLLNSLTGGSPGGPTSSSYATGADGLAGYLSLLVAEGHSVDRLRVDPAKAALPSNETVVVLDPGFVNAADARSLALFVDHGGRLIIGGAEPSSWLQALLSPAPEWSAQAVANAHVLIPVPELAGDTRLAAANDGSWNTAGAALPVYGGAKGSLVAVASLGRGRVILLADASMLQNQYLGSADNARFALAAAGAPSRPVAFFESYHGYGPASGFSSVPGRWLLLLAGLVVAAVALMIARGRRLGPPEPESRDLPPPRRAYVDSVAGILARARRPDEALEPVRAETVARIARRAGLPEGATLEQVEAAARRLGLPDAEIDAMLGRPGTGDPVLTAGRALVHAGGTDARRDG
jgi:hypothetical protein